MINSKLMKKKNEKKIKKKEKKEYLSIGNDVFGRILYFVEKFPKSSGIYFPAPVKRIRKEVGKEKRRMNRSCRLMN